MQLIWVALVSGRSRACGLVIATILLGGTKASSVMGDVTPSLSLTVNGSTETTAYQGSPLVFISTVYHPNQFSTDALAAPLLINPQNGSWANTIHMVITDGQGVQQNLPVHLVSIPPGSLVLDQSTSGVVSWVLGPSATAAVAPGSYTAIVTLDTTSSAGNTGWNGITSSSAVSITIASLPSTLSTDQQQEQATLLATYDQLLGDRAQAITDLDNFLAQNPSAIRALATKGDFLQQNGQIADALDAYDEAVGAFYSQHPNSLPEQPGDLLASQGRLRSTLLTQTGRRGTPQVQITVTNQVMQSPSEFFLDLQISNIGSDVAQSVLLNGFELKVLDGSGQAFLNNVLSAPAPIALNFLATNASAQARIFVNTQGPVNSVSLTVTGTAADIFGTQAPFSQTQTISLNSSGGGGGTSSPLTITAPSATQVYGQATPAINNVSYSGFVNGDGPGSLSGTLTCVTTAQQSSPVGSYPITCSGLSSSSYTITFLPGTLSITPAALTIAAQNASRQFGQGNPLFTASFGAFANNDNASSLSGTIACTSIATASSSISGSPYPINCGGVSSANYKINFIPGSLTITKAAPIITWNNPADITQGAALGASQLNATANVPGVFTYLPASGTVLSAGATQALAATFTPTDSVDYNSASAAVKINVKPKPTPIPGDLNGDGVVNCGDLNIVKAAFNKKTGQAPRRY